MPNSSKRITFSHDDISTAIIKEPITVSPETPVMEAIFLMSGMRSHCNADSQLKTKSDHLRIEACASCVIVIESGGIVGVLTERDVVRLSATKQSLGDLRMSQVMTKPVVTVKESSLGDLFATINLLQLNQIRHLPIVNEQGGLVGLVTHETLREMLQPSDLLRLRLVREVMIQDVVTADPTDSLLAVAQKMANHRVSCVVIVNNCSDQDLQTPIGMVTERDLVQFQALELDFERHRAEQVMSHPVVTVAASEALVTVQQLMEGYGISRVVVTGSADELLGIVTQSNLIQALSPFELYKLTEVLEAKVNQLESEKLILLQNRNQILETQVMSRTEDLRKQLQREQAVNRLATQIRSSMSLQDILDTAVEQIHQIVGCDRINVWKFENDFSWVVMAESANPSYSLIGTQVKDESYLQYLSRFYFERDICIVADMFTTEMEKSYRDLSTRLHIRAEVLLPLFCGEKLWGLLSVAESHRARDWQVDEIDLLRSIMTQLDIAVHQASTLEQLHAELQERQKAETILQIKNVLLTRVAAQKNLTDTLNHICITLEGILEGALCSILLLDSRNQLHEGAAPSLPDAYRRQIDGISVGEGVGSCGTALHRREKVIVSDIANDPLWRDYKDLALEFGLRACWSNPILATDQSILGVFGIYYQEVHAPTNADMALVDDLVPIIMLAIQRHQRGVALKQTTQRLQEAQRIANLGNWEFDIYHNTHYWSDEIFHILEIDPQQIVPSYDAFWDLVHFEDRAIVSETHAIHLEDRQPYSLILRLQMPDGRIKYLQKQGETIQNNEGTLLFSQCTIQDITKQKEAEIRRDRAEASLRQVIEGTASLTGEHFFPALVQHISEALGVRYVSVDQAMSGGFQTLSFFTDGDFCLPQFLPYDEVPCCLQSFQTGVYSVPTNARSLYPDNALLNDLGVDSYLGVRLQNAAGDPIGNLCILHDAPLVDPEWSQTLLTIFAARAGAELERLLTSQALESLNAELEDRVNLRTAELAEREAKYRGLMDGAADAILLADFKGNIRDANPSAVEMLGYSLAELTTMHFSQIHPAEELNKLKLHFAELFQNRRAQVMGVECIRKDRSIFLIDIRASAINVGGEILAQGIFRDISDRLQIENALRESQQFLQTILDTVPLAVFWKDRNSVYLGANRHFLRDAGLSSVSELVGKNDFDLPWAGTEAEAYRAYDRLVIESESEKLNIIETQHQQDGKIIWLETNKLPLRNLAGEILGVLCTYQDITVRKQIEIALRESETRFRRVFDSNVVGMLFTDFKGLVTDANDNLLNLIGYSRADLEANRINWTEITPPECFEADSRAIQQLLYRGEIAPWEKQFMRSDGSRVSVLIGVALLSREDGRCVAVVIDISDRKAAEAKLQRTNAELERATRLKDEFLANMSHELRTPLNSILGMTEGIQEKVFGEVNEKQLNALNTVERSATHLLALINDILDVAKIESGKIILEPSLVSIDHLCCSSLNFVKQLAQAKSIQLKTIISPHLPDLFVDETRMRQVLLNLLSNAVKFTPEGGQISLTVERKRFDALEVVPLPGISDNQDDQPARDYIQFAIIDTGIGIAPENINKLFQPFVQIDSALNRQYAGTGLGLSLVKKIVELHGGNVTVTSELGKGSCFMVNLPYQPQVSSDIRPQNIAIAPESEHSQPNESELTATKAPLILLAEDNPANVATVTGYLEAKGYRLLLANNGEEAIDLAISNRPDLILMDIQMPVMDGLEAMEQIRLQDGLSEVPIIALTALTMKGDQEKCLAAGANRYLSKPVKLKELSLLIQELLKR